MIRSQFFWKLFAGYLFVILMTAALVGILATYFVENDLFEETEEKLRSQTVLAARIVESLLESGEFVGFQDRIRTLGENLESRLTVILPDGVVIADTDSIPEKMANHGDRPELLMARAEGTGSAHRESKTMGQAMLYVARSISGDGKLLGFVRCSLSLRSVAERITRIRVVIALGGGIAVLVGLMLALFIAHTVTRPIKSITSAAGSIASGHFDRKVNVETGDEIGVLARAFNQMADHLRERIEKHDKSKNQLLAVLSGMVEGVIAIGPDDRIVHMNEAAARILQVSVSQAAGGQIRDLTENQLFIDAIVKTLHSNEEVRSEIEIDREGSRLFIELSASPLRNETGVSSGAVVVLHDISDIRRLEGLRRDFVANASHELKTPVAAIRAFVETIQDDGEMDPRVRKRFLSKVLNQCSRLAALVTDLLTLSRLESGRDFLGHLPVDLKGVCDEAVHSLFSIAREKSIELKTDVTEKAVMVRGDVEALHQIVSNLLDNAIKYTPSGGTIHVKLRCDENCARLEVTDTGIGIDPEHHGRLFERFYRVDKARSREVGGTGLGLSIVKHIAISHQGQVSVDSQPGHGSTFRVEIPLVKP